MNLNPVSQAVRDLQTLMEQRLDTQLGAINLLLFGTDSYKLSHILFETEGVKEIYSNFTPRFAKYLKRVVGEETFDNKYVVFGTQAAILQIHHYFNKGFFNRPKEEVMAECHAYLTPYIGQQNLKHFEKLHDLGYLPVVIKTLDEGTLANVGTPFLTIRNTLPEFEWLPNYLETILSTEIWKNLTVATVAYNFRKVSNLFALETKGNIEGTEWQNHDFHVRGGSGFFSAGIVGVGALLSSCGADNVPALWAANYLYNTHPGDGKVLAGSVPAGEHSVTTLGIIATQKRLEGQGKTVDLLEAEYLYKEWLLTERFPTGIVSDVSDSFDYWGHLTVNLPKLKNTIMARDGKYVVRGDSGNPVHIIAGYRILDCSDLTETEFHIIVSEKAHYGVEVFKHNSKYYLVDLIHDEIILNEITEHEAKGSIQLLWDIFGGTVNEKGFKVLDSHIGMIYGDGITVARSIDILTRLKEKGFESLNIVFGVGSFSYSYLSRDHLGMAIKATNTIVDINGVDVDMPIYKEPKTDLSKKSSRGLIQVVESEFGVVSNDMCDRDKEALGLLTVLYSEGQFHKLTNVHEIRERLWK